MSVPLYALSSRLLAADLCTLLESYLDAKDVQEVYRAYLFSAEAHDGQTRKTGEPYVFHPLTVTYILGKMHMDTQTLCAALLHDVIEDTPITKEKLTSEFGKAVAEMVDGVSKLSSVEFKTREQAQAASFRKMMLAMSRDLRVIIVKLADRLHNMRTLGAMKPESQQRIARETIEIYAPIANRLGMNTVCVELEALCFKTLYPLRYKVLSQSIQKKYQQRTKIFQAIKSRIEKRFNESAINAEVIMHKRHYYAIYQEMRQKKQASSIDKRKTFHQVTNNCRFLIQTECQDDCYRILGIVHSLYKPKHDGFMDYIAIPKINGYQSLHTVLFSPHGLSIEIKIRTKAMHEMAEKGITAHGLYDDQKANCSLDDITHNMSSPRAKEWLQGLLEMQKNTRDSLEFLDHVKTDLFPEEVYVFTPNGKIMQLPKGATAIDFAYAIHSDIGNQSIRAIIDNQPAPLSTVLSSGQTVEIITAEWARPNPGWLNFAGTARARTVIRHFLKDVQHKEAILLGKRILNKELAEYSLSVDKLSKEQQTCLQATFKVDSFDTLLADIGLGNRIALIVARQFDPTPDKYRMTRDEPKPMIIRGTEGVLVNFATCCRPIPGDDIVGFISAGRGIIIHTSSCKHIADSRYPPDKLLAVEWESGINSEFLVDICVDVRDQRGILAKVATTLTNMNINIEKVGNENYERGYSTLKFGIYVRNRQHLALIMRQLRRLENVNRIRRSFCPERN
jgi:RelA/SpoT family (p)ppGpp synthetase